MAHRSARRARKTGRLASRKEHRYPTLQLIAGVYRFLGWLFLVCSGIGLAVGVVALFGQEPASGAIIVVGSLLWGGFGAVTQFAAAELLRLFMDVAGDARRSAGLLEQVASALTSDI